MKTELKKTFGIWTDENSWNAKANINMSPDKAMDEGIQQNYNLISHNIMPS